MFPSWVLPINAFSPYTCPPPYGGGGQIPPCVNGLGKTLISNRWRRLRRRSPSHWNVNRCSNPHRNIRTNPIRYKFNQTDREVFESTLEAALSSGDVPELKSTQDIDKYADFIITAISTAVDKAIPTSKSGRPVSQPVLEESLALIREKRRLRRHYSQAHDPLVKTRIN